MEKSEIDYLSNEVARQFTLVKLDLGKLVNVLSSVNIPESSKRMQYKLDKKQSHIPVTAITDIEVPLTENTNSQYQDVGFGIDFQLRRIMTNWYTGYKESKSVSAAKKFEEWWANSRSRGFDSELVCRKARRDAEIKQYMTNAFNAGHKYSVMGHFDEKVDSDEIGSWWVKLPVIIIPGLDDKGIEYVANFCKEYQKPSNAELIEMGFYKPKLIK